MPPGPYTAVYIDDRAVDSIDLKKFAVIKLIHFQLYPGNGCGINHGDNNTFFKLFSTDVLLLK
jgi:hypothetical protein